MIVIHTPDEIISLIAEVLAESQSAEWIAEVATKVLIGQCSGDDDDNSIAWEYDE